MFTIFWLMLTLPPSLTVIDSGADGAERERVSAPNELGTTPEQALRTFFLAMLTRDEPTLRATTVPNEDFDWLLGGQDFPEDQIEAIKVYIAEQPIRVLKAGDECPLPNGRVLVIQPEDVSDTSAMLMPSEAPLPVRCRKIEGRWRVDAEQFIAGRKAAEAARQKAEQPRP